MVDVGRSLIRERIAVARGEIHMKKETLDLIRAGQIKKGDVLTVAQIAGITASKRTSELIPLCHPLPLTKVDVDLAIDEFHSRCGHHSDSQDGRQNRRRNGSPDRGLYRSVDRL